MHIFYTPGIHDTGYYTLNEDESKHCIRVLRLKADDMIRLIDGKGNLYEAKIVNPDFKKCEVGIEKVIRDFNKRNFWLHMAVAPTKNTDRFEWFVEKATEIGIDEITPILCARSERKNIKPDRLEKVVIAAMKQSVIAIKPVIHPQNSFSDFIKDFNSIKYEKFIAHCAESERKTFKNLYTKGNNVLILIGPEGDFSPEEIELALKNDFQPVTLGKNRLRTETAGVVACQIVNFLND